MKRSGRQTAESAEATKKAILHAAAQLFSKKGFDGTSVREIGAKAGVSHALVSHHFGSKDDIFDRVLFGANDYYNLMRSQMITEDFSDLPANEVMFNVICRFTATMVLQPLMLTLIARESMSCTDRYLKFIDAFRKPRSEIVPLFEKVQDMGYLTEFTMNEFVVVQFSSMIMPAAMPHLAKAHLALDESGTKEYTGDFVSHYVKIVATTFAPMLGIIMNQVQKAGFVEATIKDAKRQIAHIADK